MKSSRKNIIACITSHHITCHVAPLHMLHRTTSHATSHHIDTDIIDPQCSHRDEGEYGTGQGGHARERRTCQSKEGMPAQGGVRGRRALEQGQSKEGHLIVTPISHHLQSIPCGVPRRPLLTLLHGHCIGTTHSCHAACTHSSYWYLSERR